MPAHDAEDLPLEDRINRDSEAKRAVAKLCRYQRVDKQVLLDHIDSLELLPLTEYKKWADQSTLTKVQARALADRLSKTADEIKGFFQPDYFWYLTVQNKKFLWLNLVQWHLRLTAGLVNAMLELSDDRAGPAHDPAEKNTIYARVKLTRYVLDATGKPHDREVAALTAVVLGRETYTADDQRKFRKKHCT